jgi:hypothetical protein
VKKIIWVTFEKNTKVITQKHIFGGLMGEER